MLFALSELLIDINDPSPQTRNIAHFSGTLSVNLKDAAFYIL